MTHRHPPRAILDADILYSRVLYEFMGRIAAGMRELDLVWSDQLIDEATRVLRTRKGLPAHAAKRWVSYLQTAFPAGRVDISDALADDKLAGLTSDPDDLHVCALAIASNADYLFTADRGYLRDKLASMGVTTMHPDGLLVQLLDSEPSFECVNEFGDAAAAGPRACLAPVQNTSPPAHAAWSAHSPSGRELSWAILVKGVRNLGCQSRSRHRLRTLADATACRRAHGKATPS